MKVNPGDDPYGTAPEVSQVLGCGPEENDLVGEEPLIEGVVKNIDERDNGDILDHFWCDVDHGSRRRIVGNVRFEHAGAYETEWIEGVVCELERRRSASYGTVVVNFENDAGNTLGSFSKIRKRYGGVQYLESCFVDLGLHVHGQVDRHICPDRLYKHLVLCFDKAVRGKIYINE